MTEILSDEKLHDEVHDEIVQGSLIIDIDHEAERKLLRKLDIRIMPLVMGLYLFSFLDRVNIGNARLYGLEADLGMAGNQFQTAVSLFYITYVLSEVPSNLVLKYVGPTRWIAFIVTGWGIIATLSGICQNYGGILACRILLGIFEGGLWPALSVYLTFFYTRRELALRIACLFTCSGTAGAVGGLVAYVIGYMDHIAGLRAWRWIFILEGIPSVLLGVVTFFALANHPDSAPYLSSAEKSLLRARMQRQTGYSVSGQIAHKEDIIKGFTDWKVWVFCVAQFCGAIMLYGYSTFLPTIILGLGTWTTAQVQALTIPCYALGVITYVINAFISDRYQHRGIFNVIFGVVIMIGYGLLLTPTSANVHYAGCLLIGMGLFTYVGTPLAWCPMNQPRYGKKLVVAAFQLAVGNISGAVVPFLYATSDAPNYVKGQATILGLIGFGTILFGSMSLYFNARNKARRDGKEDHRIVGLTEEEIADMGDESPRFIYAR